MNPLILRRCVWDEMIYASMRSDYFGELVGKYSNREKWIRMGVLITGSGTALTVLSNLPPNTKAVLQLVGTGFGIWLALSSYGMMAREANDLHAGWNELAAEYEDLFNHLDDPDAEQRYHLIYSRAEGLSKAGTKFPNQGKRLEFWLDQAVTRANARYAF